MPFPQTCSRSVAQLLGTLLSTLHRLVRRTQPVDISLGTPDVIARP